MTKAARLTVKIITGIIVIPLACIGVVLVSVAWMAGVLFDEWSKL